MFAQENWIEMLGSRLQNPLPGLDAQLRMAPEYRETMMKAKSFRVPENAKQSAVLILLYPGENGLMLPLIERTAYEGVHSRQIGLPGGQLERSDLSHIHAAMREAEEEIGVLQSDVQVLGQLSPLYIPPSNFFVQPVLGVAKARPSFVLDPVEVASLIETPVQGLLSGEYHQLSKIQARGSEWEVPSYQIQGHVVWGATAMMLSELVALLEELR